MQEIEDRSGSLASEFPYWGVRNAKLVWRIEI